MRWKERQTCPFFLFVQNPNAEEGTGSMTCTHASPNVGDGRNCDEGTYLGPGSQKKCRILTSFLKKGNFQSNLTEFIQ